MLRLVLSLSLLSLVVVVVVVVVVVAAVVVVVVVVVVIVLYSTAEYSHLVARLDNTCSDTTGSKTIGSSKRNLIFSIYPSRLNQYQTFSSQLCPSQYRSIPLCTPLVLVSVSVSVLVALSVLVVLVLVLLVLVPVFVVLVLVLVSSYAEYGHHEVEDAQGELRTGPHEPALQPLDIAPRYIYIYIYIYR